MEQELSDHRLGIQSVELGFRLLKVLARHGRPMMLKDLSAQAGMAPAKAHRYLVSFLRLGLVEQDRRSGRYDLGGWCLELGLAGLARLDPVRLADTLLEDLCETIHETVALAVWGNHGATIVRWVDAGGPVIVSLRPGSVMPLVTSATGRAFAAFCKAPYLRTLLHEELQAQARAEGVAIGNLRAQLERSLAEIRRRGIARASGSMTPGINGFSAPVYDHNGAMVAAITALGPVGNFDTDWDSPLTTALRAASRELSVRLGARLPDAPVTDPASP